MCNWTAGHNAGVAAGKLVKFGGTIADHQADLANKRTITLSYTELNDIYKRMKTFLTPSSDYYWGLLGPVEGKATITRTQLHNLLMIYGAPSKCLTDEIWTELCQTYPPD
jgi:hypothetical protein